MQVGGLVKFSTIDFPNCLSAVVFLQGCNLNCSYCHNRHLLTLHDEPLSYEDVMNFLKKRAGLLDGVVISGGEPTIWDGLPSFILDIRNLGFKIKLDTNGTNPKVVESLLENGLLDYVAVDYKAPKSRYSEICDCEVDPLSVLAAIDMLRKSSVPWEVRTTVLPQLSAEDFSVMAEELPKLPKYRLNRYRRPTDNAPAPYTEEEFIKIAKAVKTIQSNTIY